LLLAAGVFRLGWDRGFCLSIPVTTGSRRHSAHILISQLPGILGVAAPRGRCCERLATLAAAARRNQPFTLAIGLGVLATIAVTERIDARIPAR